MNFCTAINVRLLYDNPIADRNTNTISNLNSKIDVALSRTPSMFYKGWLIRDAFLELVNFSRILRDGH